MLFLLFMSFMSLTETEKNKRSMSMGILILEYLMAAILIFLTFFVNFKPMKLILENPLSFLTIDSLLLS
jgi:low temperature requirement protein LtrA